MASHEVNIQDTLDTSSIRSLEFMPVNDPASPPGVRARRTNQACDRCRERKARCEPYTPSLDDSVFVSCLRCKLDMVACRTTHPRKRRKLRSSAKLQCEDINIYEERTTHSTTAKERNGGIDDPLPGLLAGSQTDILTLPIADDAVSNRDANDQTIGSPTSTATKPTAPSSRLSEAKDRIKSTRLLNAPDALDLLTFAATEDQLFDYGLMQQPQVRGQVIPNANAAMKSSISSQVRASHGWESFFLVRQGIVQKQEAIEYFDFYFGQLWPPFPVIPGYYNAPDRYLQLVTGEPILAMALVALASRYHPLNGSNGHIRSERIHWRSWSWVQKYFQSAMWGSSCMRRPGAVAALLLFIEWHCKPMNSTEDFIGVHEDLESCHPITGPISGLETGTGRPQNLNSVAVTSMRRSNLTTLLEKLNIVAPGYRSNKMSWMLLSTARGLAEEIGCFDEATYTTVASGESAGISSDTIEWNRTLSIFIHLADENLSLRLGYNSVNGPQYQHHDFKDFLPQHLAASDFWESTLELADIMAMTRGLLRATQKQMSDSQVNDTVTTLRRIGRALERWKRRYDFDYSGGKYSLPAECLILEYHYIRLVCNSPAAYISSVHGATRSDYISDISPFVSEAASASQDILKCLVDVLAPSQQLRYIGVKYWVYIVCAMLFLLKNIVVNEDLYDNSHGTILLIRCALSAMKENAPDDMHMAQRYATFIEVLTNVALRSTPCTVQPLSLSRKARMLRDDELVATQLFGNEDISGFEELRNNSLLTDESFWNNLGWADLSSYLEQ